MLPEIAKGGLTDRSATLIRPQPGLALRNSRILRDICYQE
jgi:hypothetical protein